MPDASLIARLYRSILLREAGPGELQYWMSVPTANASSPEALKATMISTSEVQAYVAPIIRLYENILNRTPDTAGLAWWATALRSGALTLDGVTAGFLNSPEARALGWSAGGTEFVTRLYQAMGRSSAEIAADPGGVAYWTAALNGGSLSAATVARMFNEAPENIQRTHGVVAGYLALSAEGVANPSAAQTRAFSATASLTEILVSAATVTSPGALPTGIGVAGGPRALASTITFDEASQGTVDAVALTDIGRVLTAALDAYGRHYRNVGTIDVAVTFEDLGDSVLAMAGPTSMVNLPNLTFREDMPIQTGVQAKGSYGVRSPGALHELAYGVDPNGTDADVEIVINSKAVSSGLFYFDPDPRDATPIHTPAVPGDKFDFYTVMLHELGHAFGVNGYRDDATGALAGTEMSTFDRYVQFMGPNGSRLPYFHGPAAMSVWGDAVPLGSGGYSLYHLAGVGQQRDLFEPSIGPGERRSLSLLDFAVLRDAGIQELTVAKTGTDGSEFIPGGAVTDIIDGGWGDDTVMGGPGDDILRGGGGNDRLTGDAIGSSGRDILLGGDGNDYLEAGDGADRLDGEAGNDALYGGRGADTLHGGTGEDTLFGDLYADRFNAPVLSDAANHVDLLEGGDGNDRLVGRTGADILYGGAGTDRFALTHKSDSTGAVRDRIMDFRGAIQEVVDISNHMVTFYRADGPLLRVAASELPADLRSPGAHAQNDRIDLTEIDANESRVGHQSFEFIGQAAFAPGRTGVVNWYRVDTSIIVQGETNNDGVADFAIELVGVGAFYELTAQDFV